MKNHHTLISLFAGAGGLDIGLEMAGFRTAAVNEIGAHACETLRQNKVLRALSPNQFEAWLSTQAQNQKCYTKYPADEIDNLRARLQSATGDHSLLAEASIVEGDIRQISTQQLLSAAKVKAGIVGLRFRENPATSSFRGDRLHF